MGKASKETQAYQKAQANVSRNYNLRKIKEPDELVRLFEEYLETCHSTVVKNTKENHVQTLATKAGFFRHLVKTKGFKPESTKRWFRELPRDFDGAKDYIEESLEEYNTLIAGKGDVMGVVFTAFAKAKYEDYKDTKYVDIKTTRLGDMSFKELEDRFNEIALLDTTTDDERPLLDTEDDDTNDVILDVEDE